MTRVELEHVLRAAAAITGHDEIVVVGTQAILGQYPEAPSELRVSKEADIYTPSDPATDTLIEGALGEGSKFHEVCDYYSEGRRNSAMGEKSGARTPGADDPGTAEGGGDHAVSKGNVMDGENTTFRIGADCAIASLPRVSRSGPNDPVRAG